MAYINETVLKKQIKENKLGNLYLLFGEENFLTSTYVSRLIGKSLGKEPSDFNLVHLPSNLVLEEFLDHVEGLPFFAEYKCIVVNDFDAEKYSNDEIKELLLILEDIPPTTIVIFSITGIEINPKKLKARTKKFFATVDSNGFICEFSHMTANKIGDMVVRKVAKGGGLISKENARYLAELTQRDLIAVGNETEKLMAFSGEEEITKDVIDSLVPKQIDTKVFALTDCILGKNKPLALTILDDLFYQRIDGIIILSVLSGTFLDLYRSYIGRNKDINPSQLAANFNYPRNKVFLINKAFSASTKVSIDYLRYALQQIFNADLKLKTTSTNSKILLEQLVISLMMAG